MSGALATAVLWRSIREGGVEFCLLRRDEGWSLEGTAIGVNGEEPFQGRYRVSCDGAWRTRHVDVEVRFAHRTTPRLVLTADGEGRWWSGERELPQVAGCVDVDLGFSPSTNTLPVRRLALETGRSADVVAAWVKFPELALERLPQRYTRLGNRRYRYESLLSGFTADLEVDEEGLVIDYPDGWSRMAAAQA